jgi:hypothetical protein
MNTITIELTDTQLMGLQYAAFSPQEWAANAVVERARIANDEIVQKVVAYCLENEEQIPSSRQDIVAYGFSSGVVKTAAQNTEETTASLASKVLEQ